MEASPLTLGDLRPLPADGLLDVVTTVQGLVWRIEGEQVLLELPSERPGFHRESLDVAEIVDANLIAGDDVLSRADRLIQMVLERVVPHRWDPPASIDFDNGLLLVRQTADAHAQIAGALDGIRRAGRLLARDAAATWIGPVVFFPCGSKEDGRSRLMIYRIGDRAPRETGVSVEMGW